MSCAFDENIDVAPVFRIFAAAFDPRFAAAGAAVVFAGRGAAFCVEFSGFALPVVKLKSALDSISQADSSARCTDLREELRLPAAFSGTAAAFPVLAAAF